MPAVESLPTKPKPKSPAAHEIDAFVEKYELYADLYGDPVEVAFRVMANNADKTNPLSDEEVALRAADMLMSYRYPRIKAVQGQAGPNGPQVVLNIDLSGRITQPSQEIAPAYEVPRIAAPAVDLSGILGDD